MSIRRNKLNIGKARRRVQTRSALLLTMGVCFAMACLRGLRMTGVPALLGAGWTLLEMAATLACFGGGAYLGLCVLDGDHSKSVPLRALSRAQILWLSLLGVLAVAPVSLAGNLLGALTLSVPAVQPGAPSGGAFVTTLVKSALLAPICEELFFRGYLLPALGRHGGVRACVVTALCFALVHPMEGAAPLLLLGLLLGWMQLRTGSLLAPVLMHMSYNAALILAQYLGLGWLIAGWSLISCAIRLALCAAFAAVLKRAYTARAEGGSFALWEGGKLTRREIALLAVGAALLGATLILGG